MLWKYFCRKRIRGKDVGEDAISCALAQLARIPSAWKTTEESVDEIVILDAALMNISLLPIA
jgi:hypothetical protein